MSSSICVYFLNRFSFAEELWFIYYVVFHYIEENADIQYIHMKMHNVNEKKQREYMIVSASLDR